MPVTSTKTISFVFAESSVNMLEGIGVVRFKMLANGVFVRDVICPMNTEDLMSIYGAVPPDATAPRADDLANAYYAWAIERGHIDGTIE